MTSTWLDISPTDLVDWKSVRLELVAIFVAAALITLSSL